MQCTPLAHNGDKWVVEVNSIMDTRHGSMLWGRGGADAYNRWGNRGEMAFTCAEDAILFCKNAGWDYEVMFGGFRYHQTKSYAENFMFRKEELSDTEEGDIKFERI